MHVSSTARRYGRALARVAIANKLEKTVGAELVALVAFFHQDGFVRLTLESPATREASRIRLIGEIAAAIPQLSQYTKNMMEALAQYKRFHLFAEVAEAYRREVDRYHDIVEVEVVSATELDDKQREVLRGTLARAFGGGTRDVRLDLSVDPRLIAGIVARVGSVVHDGSLRHQLGQIRQQLISE